VRIGVNVPNFGPGTDPGMLRSWAQTVEGLGFDLLMVSDHVAVTPDVAEQYPAPFYEPFTTLAWLAGLTSRVRLRHHGPHSAVPAPAADRPDGRQP
jgi:alkanesulfonate monooxygenase SsuD/methylene tetrahydromethanopterin reductase-like flavin-dependent oxidoreductase (luciferase family)